MLLWLRYPCDYYLSLRLESCTRTCDGIHFPIVTANQKDTLRTCLYVMNSLLCNWIHFSILFIVSSYISFFFFLFHLTSIFFFGNNSYILFSFSLYSPSLSTLSLAGFWWPLFYLLLLIIWLSFAVFLSSAGLLLLLSVNHCRYLCGYFLEHTFNHLKEIVANNFSEHLCFLDSFLMCYLAAFCLCILQS